MPQKPFKWRDVCGSLAGAGADDFEVRRTAFLLIVTTSGSQQISETVGGLQIEPRAWNPLMKSISKRPSRQVCLRGARTAVLCSAPSQESEFPGEQQVPASGNGTSR